MSELLKPAPKGETCQSDAHPGPVDRIHAREATLGPGLRIRRALPRRARRMVGAWCFLDHFGPLEVRGGRGLDVGPHPHTGLQTVTWLIEGRILHRDSLGNEQLVRPGQLNLMTAGRGISHSEESPADEQGRLHGVQLWVAQPEADRHGEPDFAHHAELPVFERDAARITLFAGEMGGERAPARMFSPLAGAEIHLPEAGRLELPLDPDWEYALLPVSGEALIENETFVPGELADLHLGRACLELEGKAGSRYILIGGEPFPERILMWWNFIGRTADEIAGYRAAWETGEVFGEVAGYPGERLSAPEFTPGIKAD
jgi:redox-sensitive bicupin YhaK (pirin superfamily)